MLRAIGFGLIVAAGMALASAGAAGELIPAVGTDAWFAPPAGFIPVERPADGFTVANDAGGVISVTQAFPGSPVQVNFEELAADPQKLTEMAARLPDGTAELITGGATTFLVVSAEVPPEAGKTGRIWYATNGGEAALTLTFVQLDTGPARPAIDKTLINEVLASVVVDRPNATDAAIAVRGLRLPIVAPFSFAETSEVGMARLYTVADRDPAGDRRPSVLLLLPSADRESMSLEQIGARWLGSGEAPKLVSSREAVLLGRPALRQEWTATVLDKPRNTTGYVTVFGGQRVVLAVAGAPELMTPEITSKIDEIAGALTPGDKPE